MDQLRVIATAAAVSPRAASRLQRVWSETTWRMPTLRDNPECAEQEYDRILDAADPGSRRP